eukprot:4472360-Alexandrium_andersonii.AAC.1
MQQHELLTSKYLDKLYPPSFIGKTEDFEPWSSRLIWFIEMKRPRVANALQNTHLLRLRQLLHEFALEQVQAADTPQQAEHMAKLIVAAGREIFGYLQLPLQGAHLDIQ